MTLESVVGGRQRRPRRIFLFGPEGIGKTTFGFDAPNPIFIGAEDGTGELDARRFQTPYTWPEVLEALEALRVGQHDYKTAVVDTVDWLEPLIWAYCCKRDQEASIESYGYGKGYQVALDEWRILLRRLEHLRARGLEVILLGHSAIRTFKNPEGDDYDRYNLKIHEKAGGLLKEWCDAVLFASFETYAKGERDKAGKLKGKAKGVSTGARLIHTVRSAAFDAKNRYGLPEELPLSYADFDAAAKAGADVEALKAEIKRKAAELGGDFEPHINLYLGKAGDDASKLSVLNNWANTKLAAKAAEGK